MKTLFTLSRPKNRKQYFPSDYIPRDKKFFKKENESFELRKLRSSKQWQDLVDYVKNKEPICWICEIKHVDEVHHIIEAHERIDLFFDITNLAPLCLECHKQVHASYRRGIVPEMIFDIEKRMTYKPIRDI